MKGHHVRLATFDVAKQPKCKKSKKVAKALDNVVKNAFEAYGDQSGLEAIVTLKALATVDTVHLRITKSGRGISAQDMAFVRDPFCTTKAVGAGMGLAVAERIMTQHGGTLEVASPLGEGTLASLVFPRALVEGPA